MSVIRLFRWQPLGTLAADAPLQRLISIYEKLGPPRDVKLLFCDAAAARDSLESNLAYGHFIEPVGEEMLREAYSFLR